MGLDTISEKRYERYQSLTWWEWNKIDEKERYKSIVKQKIEKLGIEYLENVKKSHSKTEFLDLKKFSPQLYLFSKCLKTSDFQNLFKLRNNMIDVKENLNSSLSHSMWCRTCCIFRETQQHLLECPPIKMKLKDIVDFENLSYNMIYGNLKNQEKFGRNYTIIWSARNDIMDGN